MRDFPGGPVVKSPTLPLQGAQIRSLVGEPKIPHAAWRGQKKKKERVIRKVS